MLQIVERPREVAAAAQMWEAKYRKNATVFSNGLLYHADTCTWGVFKRWRRRDGSTRYWNGFGIVIANFRQNIIVEINPDDRRSARDMQGIFATDSRGHIWLFHRGRMKSKLAGISEAMFDSASGLKRETLTYLDGSTIGAHRVARIDDVQQLQSDIASFIMTCKRVRAYYESGPNFAAAEQLINEAESSTPEPIGNYLLGPREERIVTRRHGEVQRALTAALDKLGLKHNNSRVGRWGPDVITQAARRPVLFEIKTDLSAPDLQKAVGQLVLYEGLLKKAHRKVLVVPKLPGKLYLDVITKLSIEVIEYEKTARGVSFKPKLGSFL